MRGRIVLDVVAADEETLQSLGDRACALIAETNTVNNLTCGPIDRDFTLVGSIRGAPDETWGEVVRAPDEVQAWEDAHAEDQRRTLVAIVPGINQALLDSLGEGGS